MNRTVKHRSKSGFTLVELVVVIAILAILAAIAIPAVISIIHNAGGTKETDNAAELDRACLDYYSFVSTGMINSTDHGASTQTGLPAAHASSAARKTAAKNATVINACEYAGLGRIKDEITAGSMVYVYDSEGRIFAKADQPSLTNNVTASTTLGVLYNIT